MGADTGAGVGSGRSAREDLRGAAALLLGAGAVAVCGWAQQSRLAGPHLSAADESLVAAGYALARFGVEGVPGGARRFVELAPVAEYGRRTGAFDRGMAATGRELMLAVTLVAAALLWLLARRLGLSGPAAAGAVLLFGLPPYALAAHQHPDPAALALPWLLATAVLGTVRRRLGWLAAGGCAAVAVLTLPVTGDPVTGRTVLILAWPVVAFGLAWVAAAGWRPLSRLRTPEGRAVPVRVALAMTAGSAAVAVGVFAGGAWRVAADDDPQRQSAVAARDWVLANLRGTAPRLAVDDVTWVELVRAGYPADRLLSGTGLGPAAALPGGWRGLDLVIADPADPAALAPAARPALASSRPQARFASGGAAREVRYVVADLAAATERADAERTACLVAGSMLAGNPRLHLSGDAARALRAGDVDPRLVTVLAGITAEHDLTVAGFPAVPGEEATDVPRRTVRVSAVDGRPAATAPGLRAWLTAQLRPYRPSAVSTDRNDLVVRYDPPTPVGLLTS